MKKILLLLSLILSINSWSQQCVTTSKKDVKISWRAFKTARKAPVKGFFPSFSLQLPSKSSSIERMLADSSVSIDALKLSTKNVARDKKIALHFFGNMLNKEKIFVRVKNVSNSWIDLAVTMNKVTKEVSLSYEVKNNLLKAVGHLDVLDFSMLKSLKGINKACSARHKGQTWSVVELNLSIKIRGC